VGSGLLRDPTPFLLDDAPGLGGGGEGALGLSKLALAQLEVRGDLRQSSLQSLQVLVERGQAHTPPALGGESLAGLGLELYRVTELELGRRPGGEGLHGASLRLLDGPHRAGALVGGRLHALV
jgi:hypothetical protein